MVGSFQCVEEESAEGACELMSREGEMARQGSALLYDKLIGQSYWMSAWRPLETSSDPQDIHGIASVRREEFPKEFSSSVLLGCK